MRTRRWVLYGMIVFIWLFSAFMVKTGISVYHKFPEKNALTEYAGILEGFRCKSHPKSNEVIIYITLRNDQNLLDRYLLITGLFRCEWIEAQRDRLIGDYIILLAEQQYDHKYIRDMRTQFESIIRYEDEKQYLYDKNVSHAIFFILLSSLITVVALFRLHLDKKRAREEQERTQAKQRAKSSAPSERL